MDLPLLRLRLWGAGNRVRMENWTFPGIWIGMVMCDIDGGLLGGEVMMVFLRERRVVF